MEIVLTFLAGAFVAFMATRPAPRRTRPEPLPTTGRRPTIEASVVGVYGTAHLADGRSFDTSSPERIDIDCEIITFHMLVREDFDGTMVSHTLHLGVENVEVPIDPPIRVHKGGTVTVVQPLSVTDLESVGPLPGWAQR